MIYILGIDGLEYNFVERWNLENLKQKEHGKIEIPISRHGYATTPQIWACFLTGKQQDQCQAFEKHHTFIESLLLQFRRRIGFGLGLIKLLEKTFPLYFAIKRKRTFPVLKDSTFLDATDSRYFNVPYYDFDVNATTYYTRLFRIGKLSLSKLRRIHRSIYELRKKQILKHSMSVKAQVFFSYVHGVDSIQHCSFMDETYIQKVYENTDAFVNQLKNLAGDRTFLIVSDHGSKNGFHSDYGFYSVNEKWDLRYPKITDFYQIILRCARAAQER